MAASVNDADPPDFAETFGERSARYWKRAANMHRLGRQTETPEVRQMYLDLAMSWAALAKEMERATEVPTSVRHEDERLAHEQFRKRE